MDAQFQVKKTESLLNTAALSSIELIVNVEYSDYLAALQEAKSSNPYGAFVALHSEDELSDNGCIAILSADKQCGVAVLNDGNITGLFKSGTSQRRQVLPELLVAALANGGCKLDCFGSESLLSSYFNAGFIPVARIPFDETQAPVDWNYQRDKTPDIYFMIHNGVSPEDVLKKLGSPSMPNLDKVREFKEYQVAYSYRDSLITRK